MKNTNTPEELSSERVGQIYYVSNSGNDSNSGKSINAPWRTLSKVNKFSFQPGDVVSLKCGDIWREQLLPKSGNSKSPVTYTSYGKGNKPKILGSISKNSVWHWRKVHGNIWSALNIPVDVGNIILNGNTCGVKASNLKELSSQNEFWYDQKNRSLKIYSTSNPAKLYSSIECALNRNIIGLYSVSHVNISGLELKYGGGHGIGAYDTHHITIQNCDINYIGGGYLFDTVRYGNGIEFFDSNHNILAEGCNIWEIYDAALTSQGTDQKTQMRDIIFRNNNIWNAEWSFEYWNAGENGLTQNIYFEKNNCKGAGNSWGNKQRNDPGGIHVNLQDNPAATSGLYIRNNIFDYAKSCILYVGSPWNGIESLFMEGNQYRQPKSSPTVFVYQGTNYNFVGYQNASGKEGSSTFTEYQ